MNIKKWKTLSRKKILDHPRMQLLEDEVVLPSGIKTTYLRYAPSTTFSVAVLAIDSSQRLLLQKEYSYPTDEILWQLPGGGARTHESIEVAAQRELAEESGFAANVCHTIGFVYTNNRRSDEKQYVVVCTELHRQKAMSDPEELIENHWLSIQEVKHLLTAGAFQNVNLLAALNLYFFRYDRIRTSIGAQPESQNSRQPG